MSTTNAALLEPNQQDLVESWLTPAWGDPVRLSRVEPIWNRRHVLRVSDSSGRSAVVKRVGSRGSEAERLDSFRVELASLAFLSGMPEAIAPRLLGGDPEAGVLVMEDLPAGHPLADSLLLGDREQAGADLVSYARSLAAVHAWSIERVEDFEASLQHLVSVTALDSWWVQGLGENRSALGALASGIGVDPDRTDAEVDQALAHLGAPRFRGFVHGDLCPDNTRLVDGRCRIFDFELSAVGSVAIDAAYLLAPFPSCWCFASLPAEISGAAMDAYRQTMQGWGLDQGDEWEISIAAALVCFIATRAGRLEPFLGGDQREWGTTAGSARIVSWTDAAIGAAETTDSFPSLRAVFRAVNDRARAAAGDQNLPEYPALAREGALVVKIPDWWRPNL